MGCSQTLHTHAGRGEPLVEIVAVFVVDFFITDESPVRSVVQRLAEARGIFGEVQRTTSTTVHVYAGATTRSDMDWFMGLIKNYFSAVSLSDAAAPAVPANPVIFESREPKLLRRALLGNFVSKYSSCHAHHRALSANDEDTALRSQCSASRGMGAGGAGGGRD